MSKNTVTALRDELFSVFRDLRSETIQPRVAKEMNNAAGKIISSAKAQLDYHSVRRERPSIPFFSN